MDRNQKKMQKHIVESILPMPIVTIPAGEHVTISSESLLDRSFRAKRLVVNEYYPHVYLKSVYVGATSQMVNHSQDGICLASFFYGQKLDEVLRRLNDGQTVDARNGAVNEGLVAAVKDMTQTLRCEKILQVTMLLSMTFWNRGSVPAQDVSCHWLGESLIE